MIILKTLQVVVVGIFISADLGDSSKYSSEKLED